VSTPTTKPSVIKLEAAALLAVRTYLPQRQRNDAASRAAGAHAYGAVRSYTAAAGLPFNQAMAEIIREAREG